jgi:CTP synthase
MWPAELAEVAAQAVPPASVVLLEFQDNISSSNREVLCMRTRFIFVTGGVVSSLGKGITAASIGALLVARGHSVELVKMDPYLNVDAGTMNPTQHGEVFVTTDGYEADLDLGHYERFTGKQTSRLNNVTAGQIYKSIVEKERHGEYLGQTVQVIPHVTNEIKSRIISVAMTCDPEFMIVEIGGTVGDIEGLPFLEAIRQIPYDIGHDKCLFIHVTLLPWMACSGELKTKPTQHSVKALREIGIQADAIVCRSDRDVDEANRRKMAVFCCVDHRSIFVAKDANSVYEVPEMLRAQGLDSWIMNRFNNGDRCLDMSLWTEFNRRRSMASGQLEVAIVGKYSTMGDTYICIDESVRFAAWDIGYDASTTLIDSKKLEEESADILASFDAVIIPGGFGSRGIEGKIKATKFARENGIPFLGICLGMQVAVIEFARNVLGLHGANSREFDDVCRDDVISLMEDQKSCLNMGGTMRLGSCDARLVDGTQVASLYGAQDISERHRHRYEVNHAYVGALEEHGMRVAARSKIGGFVEIIELPSHPYFVACQFHPEFKSGPMRPHPLFMGLIKQAVASSVEEQTTAH